MKFYYLPVALVITFIVFCIVQKLSKNKRPVKRAFLSVVSGFLTLIAVNIAGIFTGVYLPVSVLSLIISAALGIPGVTAMLCVNLLF